MSVEVNGPPASPPPWSVEADACLIVHCRNPIFTCSRCVFALDAELFRAHIRFD
jgi:hypothetical protein